MAEPWTCPHCHATWAAPENHGRCHNCGYGLAPVAAGAGPAAAPNGDGGPLGWRLDAAFPPPPAPDPQTATLLKGLQEMLQPVLVWLERHGRRVPTVAEAIPALLAAVGEIEAYAVQAQERARVTPQTIPMAPGDQGREERLTRLETGLQQLALAVASLRPTPVPTAVTPTAAGPETPYPTFILTDADAAQVERQILQQQQVRGDLWRG